MKWEQKKIEDICLNITSGGTPKSTNEAFYTPQEVPWLKTGEVNYCRIYDTEKYISKEGLYNSSAKIIPTNSVIVAMYGQGDTAGRVAINKIPLTTNQACCNLIINDKVADYEFVYYKLSTLYEKMVSLKNGGAQPNLNAKIIKSIEISLPPLPIQQRIASILSAYDDLIENNQKQIKLLEEAAQRLYKEWFVDLRFPGYEGVTMVDGVPEGWKKVRLDEVTSVLKRGISPKYDENGEFTVINQKCIRKNVVDYSESRKQSKKYAEELQLQESDTVICSTGIGTLGRVGQIYNVYQNSTFDSHVTLVRANKLIGKQFLFWSLKLLQPYLMSLGKGSTNQQELYKSDLAACFLLLPEEYIMNAFERQAQELHDIIAVKTKQISSLREARDRLLPKLMSGEIDTPSHFANAQCQPPFRGHEISLF